MTDRTPDHRVVDKIRKLLALADPKRGATEAEAQLAAAKAAELMEEYGLETASLEAAGGEGESREKTEGSSSYGYWYGPLLRAVAESCFCSAEVLEGGKKMWFTLIGRRSSVASTRTTYEYLRAAIWRLSREAEKAGTVESARLFRHGCSARVIERIRERHERVLREQREQAEQEKRERAARASHPGATGGNALVVVLADWAGSEIDLNEDFRRGVAPGTTARERAERDARAAARDARYAALKDEGLADGVAWRMAYFGETRAEAEKNEAEARTRVVRPQRVSASDRRYWERQQRQQDKEYRKQSSSSYRAGRAAGEKVGLDQQIGKGSQSRRVT